jgi:monovalent cation:H+ antiporter-2, CPA2 family
MRDLELILTLTASLAAALVLGYISLRLGLSPIVGYLFAGFVVGPNTPGFVANKELADQFAEIGVILLMFGVGLQFHIEELLAVRRVAVPGALIRSLLTTVLGTLTGVAFGWGLSTAMVFGLALSVASTVVLSRVLADQGDLQTPAGHLAMGWLVVEDLFTVLVLVLLPAVVGTNVGPVAMASAVVAALVKVAAMVVLTFVIGERVIPWLLERVAATRSRELFTLTVLVVALGIAVGSVKLFGVSMALGAFLAGMVVGRTEFCARAAAEALPLRDAFAVLFFVSVGILFEPRFLLRSPVIVLATLSIIVLAKSLIALAIVALFRQPARIGLTVALATAQIGEFSFILISVGEGLGVVNRAARNAIIAAAIISITLNPLLYRMVGPLERLLTRLLKRRSAVDPSVQDVSAGTLSGESEAARRLRYRAVIVGHGPVGQTLAGLLIENQVEPVVIELNLETARRLKSQGRLAVYGDASLRGTLEAAGVESAVALILSGLSSSGASETIRHARELNPKIRIFARTNYLRDAADLRRCGADVVFSGEGEVALAMTELVLRQLGAGPDQIDRQKDRIRSELFQDAPDQGTLAQDQLPRQPNESAPLG